MNALRQRTPLKYRSIVGISDFRADMLYKLIPYILPKDDSQKGFGSLLNDPLLFADFLSAPGMTGK